MDEIHRIKKNDYKLTLSANNSKGFVEGQERWIELPNWEEKYISIISSLHKVIAPQKLGVSEAYSKTWTKLKEDIRL